MDAGGKTAFSARPGNGPHQARNSQRSLSEKSPGASEPEGFGLQQS